MGTKMNQVDLEIYKKIDHILWFDWDPLGIREIAPDEARDEYQSYLPVIYDLKKQGANSEAIAQALYEIETDTMGIGGDMEKCRSIAEEIKSL